MSTEERDDESVVNVTDAVFSYDARSVILNGVSLQINQGEVLGIIGPSGCGKSTLLRLIAGLREPTKGHIDRHLHSSGHPIAMMFQDDTLIPSKTVEANAGIFFRYNKHKYQDRKANEARINDVLEMVRLTTHAKYFPKELSGGMRRRVVFASVIVSMPQLLLLDEPFSSVDEPTRIGIHEDVLQTLKRFRMTAVLVTHDLAEAVSLCDKIVILSRSPATVVSTHVINMPRDIPIPYLRETPEFLESYGTLWSEVSAQTAVANATANDTEGAMK